MTLTIADTRVIQPIELIERSDEIYQTTPYLIELGIVGRSLDLYQLLFSANVTNTVVKLGSALGIVYLILQGGGSTAIYCDFSDAPLLFPQYNPNILITPPDVLVKIDLTIWYRLAS
ncbi:hypothetical protein LCGC14_1039900 [marine sediment metagenome]|uniref:Uncharacterized protein n=1 Tax=marine sediment metagenome TaxID=412755 RepID=A0A0F9NDQ2_9ZZZZ